MDIQIFMAKVSRWRALVDARFTAMGRIEIGRMPRVAGVTRAEDALEPK